MREMFPIVQFTPPLQDLTQLSHDHIRNARSTKVGNNIYLQGGDESQVKVFLSFLHVQRERFCGRTEKRIEIFVTSKTESLIVPVGKNSSAENIQNLAPYAFHAFIWEVFIDYLQLDSALLYDSKEASCRGLPERKIFPILRRGWAIVFHLDRYRVGLSKTLVRASEHFLLKLTESTDSNVPSI